MNRSYFLIVSFCLISFATIAGGGWTKPKGSGYFKVSHWWVNAAKQYKFNGASVPSPQEGIFNTSLYAEYGFTDRFTTILNLPYSKSANANESITGIGDTDLAFKYRITKSSSKYVLSGTVLLGLPFGEDAGGSDGSLQTGDGEFNQMMRLDLSRSFPIGKVNAYGSVYAAFNNRTDNFSDEFRMGAELGAGFLDSKIWFITRFDRVQSAQNGASSTQASDGATVFANNTEFFAFAYEVAGYVADKIGVSASYSGVFDASLIFASPAYSLGIFYDLK